MNDKFEQNFMTFELLEFCYLKWLQAEEYNLFKTKKMDCVDLLMSDEHSKAIYMVPFDNKKD
jgi:hypothetical protein